MGVGGWQEFVVQCRVVSGYFSGEPAIPDFPDSGLKREGNVGFVYDRYYREVAERYLLERQEDLWHVD